jgi:hypothetical protein
MKNNRLSLIIGVVGSLLLMLCIAADVRRISDFQTVTVPSSTDLILLAKPNASPATNANVSFANLKAAVLSGFTSVGTNQFLPGIPVITNASAVRGILSSNISDPYVLVEGDGIKFYDLGNNMMRIVNTGTTTPTGTNGFGTNVWWDWESLPLYSTQTLAMTWGTHAALALSSGLTNNLGIAGSHIRIDNFFPKGTNYATTVRNRITYRLAGATKLCVFRYEDDAPANITYLGEGDSTFRSPYDNRESYGQSGAPYPTWTALTNVFEFTNTFNNYTNDRIVSLQFWGDVGYTPLYTNMYLDKWEIYTLHTQENPSIDQFVTNYFAIPVTFADNVTNKGVTTFGSAGQASITAAGVISGVGSGLTALPGAQITAGTVNSNAFNAATSNAIFHAASTASTPQWRLLSLTSPAFTDTLTTLRDSAWGYFPFVYSPNPGHIKIYQNIPYGNACSTIVSRITFSMTNYDQLAWMDMYCGDMSELKTAGGFPGRASSYYIYNQDTYTANAIYTKLFTNSFISDNTNRTMSLQIWKNASFDPLTNSCNIYEWSILELP